MLQDVADTPDVLVDDAGDPGGGTVMIEFSRDVSSAFELLVGRVQAELDGIHRDGAAAFIDHQYEQARQAATQAEQLVSLGERLAQLRKQWQDLASSWMESSLVEVDDDESTDVSLPLPAHPPGNQPVLLSDPEPPSALPERKARWTATTPEQEFQQPILEVLVDMGGSGSKDDVLDRVGQVMYGLLTAVDCSPIRGGNPHVPLWRITAEAAKRPLVREGLLKGDSPKDVWEITDEGRRKVPTSSAA